MLFEHQLRALGFEVETHGSRCVISYSVSAGRLKGRKVRLGFDVPPEYPRSPPSGPHISPRILEVNPSAQAHPERVHESDFGNHYGEAWIYLSRPMSDWRGTEGVAKVLAHVDYLLETS